MDCFGAFAGYGEFSTALSQADKKPAAKIKTSCGQSSLIFLCMSLIKMLLSGKLQALGWQPWLPRVASIIVPNQLIVSCFYPPYISFLDIRVFEWVFWLAKRH